MSEPYLYEFLYRGRLSEPSAWHLIVAVDTPDPLGGPPHRSEKTLNMTQAAEAGWPLPQIVETINSAVMCELEASRDEIQQLKTTAAQLVQENQQLKAVLEDLASRHNALMSLLNNAVAQRRAEITQKVTNPAAAIMAKGEH